MSDKKEKKYLWAIEWSKFFVEQPGEPPPGGMIFYSIALHPDVKEEDFEKFMKEEAFPAVDGISTRAVFYKSLYLLRDIGKGTGTEDPSGFLQVEDIFKKLDSLGTRKLLAELDSKPPSS